MSSGMLRTAGGLVMAGCSFATGGRSLLSSCKPAKKSPLALFTLGPGAAHGRPAGGGWSCRLRACLGLPGVHPVGGLLGLAGGGEDGAGVILQDGSHEAT